ncbi:MAG: NAD(P)H-hydrate dehydratase [Acidobacteriaceae bacterium]|nr:NAD(P)H-hydrate dehydratase [Acidobacteriaceae bacterium]
MKILSSHEMTSADRLSVEAGISIHSLMEAAGSAVARFAQQRYPQAALVVVLAGKGNNGGDGMVAARLLAAEGKRRVRLVLLGQASELKGDALAAWEACGAQVERVEALEAGTLETALQGAALIVDAVLGTGFKPPVRGLAAVARDLLASCSTRVLAVDVPSGWDADSLQQSEPEAFRADAVVTFAAPKLAHLFGHMTAPNSMGPVVVAPIGTPESAIGSEQGLHWTGSAKALTETPRNINSNKGRFGHVLIVGGALGKAGAPSMSSLAALRAGAGLVTAAVVPEILPTVAQIAPELMLTPLDLQASEFDALLKGITVLAIGPGFGTEAAAAAFVPRLLRATPELPVVLDADALNIVAKQEGLLRELSSTVTSKGKPRSVVLTPHPGEFARLTGLTVKEVEADRIRLARDFATKHGVTLVLKGWRTLVAHPDGHIGVNSTGNPSMAKGGSGDILTGIVAAMLGQFPDRVADAVETAVYLHGLAGEFATVAQDEHTVLATDTVHHLCDAFQARATDADYFTWITGLAKR